MIYYDKLYRKNGTRRLAHFIKPRILDSNSFIFPMSSALFWFKVSDVIEYITKDISYLRNSDRVFVNSILEYKTEPVGRTREVPGSPNSIITDLARKEKEFRFLKPNQTNIKITDRMLTVYNYGALTYKYKYSAHPMNRLYKFTNCISSALETVKEVDRNIFITLDIPTELPTRVELTKYSNRMLTSYLDKLPTYKYFTLLELWKYLTPELKDTSVFNRLNKNDYNKVNIMFIVDTKMVLLNFSVLAGIVDEYGLPSEIEKQKASTVRKLLYIMLYKLINLPISTEDDIVKSDLIPDKLISIKEEENEEEDIVDVDDELENNIKEKELPNIRNEDDDEDNTEIDVSATDIKSVVDTKDNRTYSTIEDIKKEIVTEKDIEDKIEYLGSNNLITKKESITLINSIKLQKNKPSPFGDKEKIGDLLDITKDKTIVDNKETVITDNKVIFDKKQNYDTIGTITKKYIKEQYKKDIVRTVYALQNSGSVVEDYTINKNESILGKLDEHVIKIKTLNGKPSTIKINLPTVEEDGTFSISGNRYKLRFQRSDLPIRKIDKNIVALSSYYGKIFISKAAAKKDDIGYWLKNQMIKKYEIDKDLKNLVLMSLENPDANVPNVYAHFSRYIKEFRYKGVQFTFDYNNRYNLLKSIDKKDLSKIEDNGVVIVGSKENDPVVIDFENRIFIYKNKKFVEIDNFYKMLDLEYDKRPIEYSVIKLYKKAIPTVILLCYYIGLNNLLRTLKVKYRTSEPNKQTNLNSNEYIIKFKDINIIITRNDGEADLILGGLLQIPLITKNIDFKAFNDRNLFSVIYTKLEFSLLYINEIKILESMFIDPITLSILKELDEVTNFKGMLIRANELLVDDNYVNPNNINGMGIKGYERMAGMMYNELVKSVKEHENRSFFSKSKINVNPYILINKINEDSTTVLVDDLNPISAMKQSEDVTYLGSGGRSKDAMSRDTRSMHSSEIGVISEASKDSGDVGISAYMSANPKLSTTRGTIGKFDIKEDGWSSVLSTSAMLAPFALTDDVKRLNFSNIQSSHVIPIKNMRAPYVRTGYEAIVPIRSDSKFVVIAEEEGIVEKVSKTEISVIYKTLGKKKYKIKDWTSKEESGACYAHTMVPNLKTGDKFIKDDTLVYDSMFFEPDIFNKNRVIYKQGDVITVALMEDSQTHEDSAAISKKMAKHLGTNVTKVKSIIVSKDDNILNIKSVGTKIEPNDVLFTVTDNILMSKELDQRTIEILQDLKSSSPKAKLKGVINKIEIRYNCEIDELSDSLKEIVVNSDKELIEKTGYTGRVNSSYSINGKSLLKDSVEIKVYVDVTDNMGIGDKAIFANQLKFTVGEVFNYDMSAEDGTEIDALFSSRSIAARIVNSPSLIGTTSMLLEKITDNVVDMYFK